MIGNIGTLGGSIRGASVGGLMDLIRQRLAQRDAGPKPVTEVGFQGIAGTNPYAKQNGMSTGIAGQKIMADFLINPYGKKMAGVYIGNPSDPGDDQGRQTYG